MFCMQDTLSTLSYRPQDKPGSGCYYCNFADSELRLREIVKLALVNGRADMQTQTFRTPKPMYSLSICHAECLWEG